MKVEGSTDNFGTRADSVDLRRYSGEHSDGSEDHESEPRRTHRATLKSWVRCEFTAGEKVCQRCQAGNYDCIPRSRKKRKPAPTHEDLQLKAHNLDSEISALLLKFDNLKAHNRIRHRLSRSQHPDGTRAIENDGFDLLLRGDSPTEVEVMASFSSRSMRGADMVRLTPPDIVRFCALSSKNIRDLFAIFFERINPFFSILDPDLHTPQALIWTCPYLFTVICSTAARYYEERPDLYSSAQDYARDAAANALVDGPKTVDVCQAYLLMALYPPPKKKWEEDRRWILMGLAIRIALELELNKPAPSCDEREQQNRIRTWLNCYCVDASHAIQFGKIPMLQLDDHMAVHSQSWYQSTSLPFDVHLCAYVQIIVIMAQWRHRMEGDLRQKIRDGLDIVQSAIATEESLDQEMNHWAALYDEQYSYNPLSICLYRGDTTRLITAYLRLVVLAAGFQHAARTTTLTRDSEVLKRSIGAAKSVIEVTVKRLYPTGNLRYAMEANFVYVAFAAAYLVNLLRPKFLALIREDLQREIVTTVTQLVKILASDKVALDGRHTPALYSRFLANLMVKHNVLELVPLGEVSPIDPDILDSLPGVHAGYSQWPDVRYSDSPPGDPAVVHSHEMDMDFSLNHFVRTVSQDAPVSPNIPMAPNFGPPTFVSEQHWPEAVPAWSLPDAQYANQNTHWNQQYNGGWRH